MDLLPLIERSDATTRLQQTYARDFIGQKTLVLQPPVKIQRFIGFSIANTSRDEHIPGYDISAAKPAMHLFGFRELTASRIHVDQAVPKQDIGIQKASTEDLAMDFFTFLEVSPASAGFEDAGKRDGIWGDALNLHLHEAMESLMAIRLGSGIACNEGIPREHVADGKLVVQLLCFGKETASRVRANEGAGASHGAIPLAAAPSPSLSASAPSSASASSSSSHQSISFSLLSTLSTLLNPNHPKP
jgi:hypothetical protein